VSAAAVEWLESHTVPYHRRHIICRRWIELVEDQHEYVSTADLMRWYPQGAEPMPWSWGQP